MPPDQPESFTGIIARSVTAASKLLEIPRASLSTFLNASDRNDLWVETPRGRKVFTREHLERISEAYYSRPKKPPHNLSAPNEMMFVSQQKEFERARARLQKRRKSR